MATARTRGPGRAEEEAVGGVILNLPVHPEVRRRLRIAAVKEDLDMYEWLHRALCAELDCLELLHQVPRRP